MTEFKHIIVDQPADHVSRITLNRPESRNALNNTLRTELYGTLQHNDKNPEIRVTIIRGAGKAFCAGYDLKANNRSDQPFHTAGGDGNWPRHVVDGFFGVWDLAKPVIAQVHGYCLAGGTELATSCDLVYVAGDAKINIDTDLRLASTAAIRKHFTKDPAQFDPRKYLLDSKEWMKKIVIARLTEFGCAENASKINPIPSSMDETIAA